MSALHAFPNRHSEDSSWIGMPFSFRYRLARNSNLSIRFSHARALWLAIKPGTKAEGATVPGMMRPDVLAIFEHQAPRRIRSILNFIARKDDGIRIRSSVEQKVKGCEAIRPISSMTYILLHQFRYRSMQSNPYGGHNLAIVSE